MSLSSCRAPPRPSQSLVFLAPCAHTFPSAMLAGYVLGFHTKHADRDQRCWAPGAGAKCGSWKAKGSSETTSSLVTGEVPAVDANSEG